MKVVEWQQFFRDFSQPDNIVERVDSNLRLYTGNYAIIATLCLLFVGISRPLFFVVLLVGIFGYYVIKEQKRQGWREADSVLMLFAGITVLLLISAGGPQLGTAVAASAFVIFSHAIFRTRSLPVKAKSLAERLVNSIVRDQ